MNTKEEFCSLMFKYLNERPEKEICFDEFAYRRMINEVREGIEHYQSLKDNNHDAFMEFVKSVDVKLVDHSEKNVDKKVYEIRPEDNKNFLVRGNSGVEFIEFVFDRNNDLEVIWVMSK